MHLGSKAISSCNPYGLMGGPGEHAGMPVKNAAHSQSGAYWCDKGLDHREVSLHPGLIVVIKPVERLGVRIQQVKASLYHRISHTDRKSTRLNSSHLGI